jgi:hypothetical protein
MTDFLKLAQEAYEASTTYVEQNFRADWDYSLRAFRSEHASGSKYNSTEFQHRSRLYRPKTRAIIRKNEAAAAMALFSNMEIVNLAAENPDDLMSVAGATALKEVVEYRLSRTIKTFPLVIGAFQDAMTTGTVCSYQYWEYQTRDGKKVKDQPCIELRPIENIRLDAGASWIDPVETTPYLCDVIPMYACDVRAMMESKDEKTNSPKWKKFTEKELFLAQPKEMESLRLARLGKERDPQFNDKPIGSFSTVWVLRWFMKDSQGSDHVFYTLGTENLLTDAKPIEEVYFHGKRPYVIGYSVIETHKALKSGLPLLTKHLQMEANDIQNQRLDNVKLVLNKRYYVARGRQVDVHSLTRNTPGGVTLVNDPKTDIVEANWPDVTSSSYVEQDRINADYDEITGNFNPNTKWANKGASETLGGNKMVAQGAGVMTDYLLRTIIETWWEPVLRQVVLLEQYYETDEVVLGVCAKKARLFPRFGLSQINDDLLMKEVNVTVNVGMGSSSPSERFQKFLMATQAANQIVLQSPPGANVPEMLKELYSNAGYRDGSRFWSEQQDPRLAKAMQMIQQLQQALQGKQMELQQQVQLEQQKITSNERITAAKLQVDEVRIKGDLAIRQAELAVEEAKLQLEKVKLQIEMKMAMDEHQMKAGELSAGLEEAHLKLDGERQKLAGQAMKIAGEIEKAQLEIQTAKDEHANEEKITQISTGVIDHMQKVGQELQAIQEGMKTATSGVSQVTAQVEDLRKGLGAMAGMVMMPKKKPKSFTMKKDGKKTKGVVVGYDDGSSEELEVA